MAAVVHFILGTSAAGSLRQTYPDACVAQMDDWFSHGRCRFETGNDIRSFLRARHAWWRDSKGEDSLEAVASGFEFMTEFEATLNGIEEGILWLADGTTEHLHACWLAAVLSDAVALKVAIPPNVWPDRRFQSIGIVPAETMGHTISRP